MWPTPKEYLHETEDEATARAMLAAIWNSRAELAIVQAQDILGLGSEARMNTPSTVGENWRWRAKEGSFTPELAAELREKMEACGRLEK